MAERGGFEPPVLIRALLSTVYACFQALATSSIIVDTRRYCHFHCHIMASIRLKPNSRYWIACFTDHDGRQRQASTKTTNKTQALKIATDLEQAYRNRITEVQARRLFEGVLNEVHGTQGTLTTTVRNAADLWLQGKRVEISAAGVRRYEDTLKRFINHLGSKADADLGAITAAVLESFRNDLAEALSPATVNLTVKILRGFFSYCVEKGWLGENPAARIRTIKRRSQDKKRRPFTVEEIRSILQHCSDEWRGMVLFGLYTGQRLKDISRYTWANIDLQAKEILLRDGTGKTGRVVSIPISATLMEAIAMLPATDDRDAPLFPTFVDELSGTLSNQFHKILEKAGLVEARSKHGVGKGRDAKREASGLSFHCLRYTTTSWLKNAGVSEAVAMDIVGHDSAAISRTYTKISSEAKTEAINKLPTL